MAMYARSKIREQTLDSQWEETLDDLYTHSEASHLRNWYYASYAEQAATEGDRSRRDLFLALAHSTRIHEQMCTEAIRILGGDAFTPHDGIRYATSTHENLKRSIASARTHLRLSRSSATARAIKGGNRYVARILIWIDGCNRRHIELLERSLLNSTGDVGYSVCPKCGNTYCNECYDVYCPFCQTHCEEFELFGKRER